MNIQNYIRGFSCSIYIKQNILSRHVYFDPEEKTARVVTVRIKSRLLEY
jgi:hypothetical protein